MLRFPVLVSFSCDNGAGGDISGIFTIGILGINGHDATVLIANRAVIGHRAFVRASVIGNHIRVVHRIVVGYVRPLARAVLLL